MPDPKDILDAMRQAGVIGDSDTPDVIHQKARQLLTDAGWKQHQIDRISGQLFVQSGGAQPWHTTEEMQAKAASEDLSNATGVLGAMAAPVRALRSTGAGIYSGISGMAAGAAKLAGDEQGAQDVITQKKSTESAFPSTGFAEKAGSTVGNLVPYLAGGPIAAATMGGLSGAGNAAERGSTRGQAALSGATEGIITGLTAGIGGRMAGANPSLLRAGTVGMGEGFGYGLAPVGGALVRGDTEEAKQAAMNLPLSMGLGGAMRGTIRGVQQFANRQPTVEVAPPPPTHDPVTGIPLQLPADVQSIRAAAAPKMPNPAEINRLRSIYSPTPNWEEAARLRATQEPSGNIEEAARLRASQEPAPNLEEAARLRATQEADPAETARLRILAEKNQLSLPELERLRQTAFPSAQDKSVVAADERRLQEEVANEQPQQNTAAANPSSPPSKAGAAPQVTPQVAPSPLGSHVTPEGQPTIDPRMRDKAPLAALETQERRALDQGKTFPQAHKEGVAAQNREAANEGQNPAQVEGRIDADLRDKIYKQPIAGAPIDARQAEGSVASGMPRDAAKTTTIAAKEPTNAPEVRSNPRPIPPEGVQPASRENIGSQDIQQPAQARPEAGNGQERVSGYVKGSEPGAPKMRTLAEGPKGKLETDGLSLFVNGKKVGAQSRAMEANLKKAIGATSEPVGQVRPAKETATAVEEPALPEGESKPVKPTERPVIGEGKVKHPDVMLSGIHPDAVGELGAKTREVGEKLGATIYGDSADRLRSQGHTELADKVAAVPREARALLGENAPAINKMESDANISGKAIAAASKPVSPPPTGGSRAPIMDMLEGRKPATGVFKSAVEAVWAANRLTADWMRTAAMKTAHGFNNGVGLVRMMTPEGVSATKEGSPFFKALTEDIAKRNGVTPDEVAAHFRQEPGLSDIDVAVRRDPFELTRKFKDFPSHISVDGKTVQLLELDPVRYIKALTQHAADRTAFAESFGQSLDPGADIAKSFPGLNETSQNMLRDFAKIATGKQISGDPIKEKIATVLGEGIANTLDHARATGANILKVLNLTGSTVSSSVSSVVPTGITPVANFAKGLAKAFVHARESYKQAADIGAIASDAIRFMDPHGLPETVVASLRETVGAPAKWANLWQDLVHANAGRSWTESMQSQAKPALADIARLKALGFGEAQATNLASGKGTQADYNQVIREVVSSGTGMGARAAQQSVTAQHGIMRKYGFPFASFTGAQSRAMVRMASAVARGDMQAAIPLIQRVTGLTVAGAGTVLAFSYLRGGITGIKEKTEQPASSQIYEAMLRGYIGPVAQGLLTEMNKTGKITVEDAARIASYPAGKVIDAMAWWKAVGEKDPDATSAALLNQSPGASMFRDLIAWSSGTGTPARKAAVSGYYKWAQENPKISKFAPSQGQPTLFTVDVSKLSKALASGDTDRQKAMLVEAVKQLPEVQQQAMMEGKNKQVGMDDIARGMEARRLVKPLLESKNYTALASLAKRIGPTAMRELLVYDTQLEIMAGMLKK